MGRWGDYKPSEREPICPLYLTALPPSRGLAAFQLLLSLFSGIISLHQLPSSSRTRIGELPQQTHLCPISGSANVTVGPPSPPPSLNASTLKVSFDASSSLSPKTNHQLTLLFPSKYLFCFIYLLGPVREWKEYGMCVPRISAQILDFPPAGLVRLRASSSPSSSNHQHPALHHLDCIANQLRIHQPKELCIHSLPYSPHFAPRLDALSYQPRVGFWPIRIHQKFCS